MSTFPLQPPIIATAPTAPIAPAPGPLSPAHLAQLEDAKRRQKKLRRVFTVAAIDAWLSALFAAFTFLFGILSLPGLVGLLLGIALAAIAHNSFQGLALLRQLDPRAPRRLALNQLILAATLIAYALYSIITLPNGSPELQSAVGSDPQIASMLGPIDHLIQLIKLAVYGGLIAGTLIAQGLAALYYARSAKLLQAYKAATPDWIQQIQSRL